MRILIDAANCTVGGGAAARHLLRALDKIDTGIDLIALAPAGEAFRIAPQRLRLVQLPPESSSQWWKRQRARARAVAGIGPVDIYHALTCEIPPRNIRASTVIRSEEHTSE